MKAVYLNIGYSFEDKFAVNGCELLAVNMFVYFINCCLTSTTQVVYLHKFYNRVQRN